VNRQIGVGDSKNVIVFDPLIAGLVIRRKVDHVTSHVLQLFKVKRSKVQVTKSREVSADKNTITRQCMVISTSNLVAIIDVGSTRVVYFLGQLVKQTGSRNMADIRHIKCNNQRKTSPNRRNFALQQKIWVGESNGGV